MMQILRSFTHSKLVVNSHLIIISRTIGSATGYIFWALAARFIVAGDVGLGSSFVAASLLIANLSQLGYGYGLVRFLPGSERPSELINLAFETTTVFSIGLSILFILAINIISPNLGMIRSEPAALLSFILLVVATSMNQVINWVFFARRKFTYSLIFITAQSALAIVLLVVFALENTKGFYPIVWAYTLSSATGLILSFWLFFKYSEPGFKLSFRIPRINQSPFASYLISSYVTDQLLRGSSTVLTLLVLNVLGPEANAYFYIPWAISNGLITLIGGVAASFFAEGSNRPEKTHDFMATSVKLELSYSILACLGVGLLSKFILNILGAEYAGHATALFLVLLVSIIPGTLVHIFITFFRIQTQAWYLLVYAGLDFSMAILSSFICMRAFGLIGIGYGWLISRVVMVVVGISLRRFLLWKYESQAILPQTVEK